MPRLGKVADLDLSRTSLANHWVKFYPVWLGFCNAGPNGASSSVPVADFCSQTSNQWVELDPCSQSRPVRLVTQSSSSLGGLFWYL